MKLKINYRSICACFFNNIHFINNSNCSSELAIKVLFSKNMGGCAIKTMALKLLTSFVTNAMLVVRLY